MERGRRPGAGGELTVAAEDVLHPALLRAAAAGVAAANDARARHDRAELAASVGRGADGTATMRIDEIVEAAILAVTGDVNVLSEECGWLDRGSAYTVVLDPLDGSANAAAGVPLSAFSAALVDDGAFTQALTVWTETGSRWWAVAGAGSSGLRTSGRTELPGAAVSLLRPHPANATAAAAWWRAASAAGRVRVLSSSCLEAALVATGATDAFADACTDTHRLVDLAAAVVLLDAAGGAVRDVHGRPLEFDTDLTRRWSGVVAATPELADDLAALLADPPRSPQGTARRRPPS
ncbi:MAG: inositol monophosphatase [Streptosporangiales bacterium]|nr:inositol monophosphatase [Streptosporangiales bacterium]